MLQAVLAFWGVGVATILGVGLVLVTAYHRKRYVRREMRQFEEAYYRRKRLDDLYGRGR